MPRTRFSGTVSPHRGRGAVFSYSGRISVSVTACRDMLPDPGFYAECLQAAFDELLAAATGGIRRPAAG